MRKTQGFRSNRKHKKKSKELPLIITRNGIREEISVPVESYPITPFLLPLLPGAGMLTEMEPTNKLPTVLFQSFEPIPPDFEERKQKLKAIGATEFTVPTVDWNIALYPFARFLAKIAHGISVMNYGLDGFRSYLPKYILGEDDKIFYVVGLCPDSIPLAPLEERPRGFEKSAVIFNNGILVPHFGKFAGKSFIVSRIQLFPYFNTPTYEVITGEPL